MKRHASTSSLDHASTTATTTTAIPSFSHSVVSALLFSVCITLCLLTQDASLVHQLDLTNDFVDESRIDALDAQQWQDQREQEDRALNQTLQRGLNVITSASGCHIAAWVYESGPPKMKNCWPRHRHRDLEAATTDFTQMMVNDTVFCNIKGLWSFHEEIIPHLTVPITLIAGQYHKSRFDMLDASTVQSILDHPMIAKLFIQNIDNYLPFHLTNHTKVASFPFGVQHGSYTPYQPDPFPIFKEAFWNYHFHPPPKTQDVMIGYVSYSTNPDRARTTPSGPKQDMPDYLAELARSRFIIAPNGDRPECYRHYEAIGLGAIPLTGLDPTLYSHLAAAPVVYSLTNFWNLTVESDGMIPYTRPNRRMVTEEYWIEYVDRVMGTPVRWTDRLRDNQRYYYRDFATALPSTS